MCYLKTIFLILLFAGLAKAQSIESFLIPRDSINQSRISWLDYKGNPSSAFGETITYFKKPDGYVMVKRITFRDEVSSLNQQKVRIVGNEARITSEKGYSALGAFSNEFSPNHILLKMPQLRQKSYWSVDYKNGTVDKNVSEFAAIIINGASVPAIKVTKSVFVNGKPRDGLTQATYYVQGIGYYKMRAVKQNVTMRILKEQVRELGLEELE